MPAIAAIFAVILALGWAQSFPSGTTRPRQANTVPEPDPVDPQPNLSALDDVAPAPSAT